METENFKQDVTLESILHLFLGEPLCYLNGKEIESLDGINEECFQVLDDVVEKLENFKAL